MLLCINMHNYNHITSTVLCECKYSFELRFLRRKLEFYLRVHKKGVSSVAL